MISVFDVEKLQKLLKDFYAIPGIRITVFDENSRPFSISLIKRKLPGMRKSR